MNKKIVRKRKKSIVNPAYLPQPVEKTVNDEKTSEENTRIIKKSKTTNRLKKLFKLSIFLFFFFLFITDNSNIKSLANRIETEMLRRYISSREQQLSPYDHESEISPEKTDEDESIPSEESQKPNVTIIYVTPTPPSISTDDLWNALTSYRAANAKPSIQKSDSLCAYAQKRANELKKRSLENPDNPLDGHEGFSRDAESGYLFEITGYNGVGENLAYTPSYTTAVQIIEWGWDSSAGHRSLQLSEDITHGCIVGNHPIYVGIYSY